MSACSQCKHRAASLQHFWDSCGQHALHGQCLAQQLLSQAQELAPGLHLEGIRRSQGQKFEQRQVALSYVRVCATRRPPVHWAAAPPDARGPARPPPLPGPVLHRCAPRCCPAHTTISVELPTCGMVVALHAFAACMRTSDFRVASSHERSSCIPIASPMPRSREPNARAAVARTCNSWCELPGLGATQSTHRHAMQARCIPRAEGPPAQRAGPASAVARTAPCPARARQLRRCHHRRPRQDGDHLCCKGHRHTHLGLVDECTHGAHDAAGALLGIA